MDAQRAQLVWAIAQIAAIWTVSDAGYYFLLPALGVTANYNAGSVAVTLYYGFWIGIAVITLWPQTEPISADPNSVERWAAG